MTIATGESHNGGSKIVVRGGSGVQRPIAPGPSAQGPEREDVTRGYHYAKLIGPAFMNPVTALGREHERAVFSNVPAEEPGHATPNVPSITKGEPGAQDEQERGDQEVLAEKTFKTPVRAMVGDDHVGKDAGDAVQSDGSCCRCRCFDGPAALTDPD